MHSPDRSSKPAPHASPRTTREPAEILAALEPSERAIVELLSVFYDSETVSLLARGVGKIGVRINGRSPRNDDILPILNSLKERGIVTGEGDFALPAWLMHHAMLALAQDGRLERVAAVARALRPARLDPDKPFTTGALAVREVRIELYSRRWDAARALVRALPRHVFHDLCNPLNRAWVAELPADLRCHALAGVVETQAASLDPAEEAFAMLEAEPELTDSEHRVLIEQLVLRGRLDDAERRIAGRRSVESDVARAFLLFLRGRIAEAITAYEAALVVYLKMAGKRARVFPDRMGVFFVVALIAEGTLPSLARAKDLSEAVKDTHPLYASYAILSEVLGVLAGRDEPDYLLFITRRGDVEQRDPIDVLLQAAAALWTKAKLPGDVRSELEKRLARAEAAGLRWYAAQAADILAVLARKASRAHPDIEGARLATVVSPGERWAEKLGMLLAIASAQKPAKPAVSAPRGDADRRLAWIVRKHPYGITLEPREQTRTKGAWSKGRPVAFKRLFEEGKVLGFLSESDIAACATIKGTTTYESYGRYPRTDYYLDDARALRALAGSANVLVEVSDGVFEPCEIREAAPRLEVTRAHGRLSLSLVPRPRSDEESVTIVERGPRAVEVVEFSPIHHAIGRAIGTKPLDVPTAGEAQLRAALSALSDRVAVQADLSSDAGDAEAVRGDPRPWLLLRPLGGGLSAAAHVRPLGANGPLARPGHGGATFLTKLAGRPARASRDIEEETQRFESVLAACPALAAWRSGDTDFVLPDIERALEGLTELRALGRDVAIEWPDGEALQVSEAIGLEHLRWIIKSNASGFLAHGTLAIPDHKDLELADLADYLSASPSRFLRLADEERYLALTADLRKRLDEILGLSERSGRGLRIHPLAASLVADLLGSSRVDADKGWRLQVARFTASGAEVSIPSTLRGELRPYQLDGFRWLERLSRWGAGGCLADDMGLGKTIQAIALLLHRAPEGPALVVAPTSVVPTWVDEVTRFAPTLRVRTFAGPARAEELAGLGPFDLLVTSYGLLQRDIDALAELDLATVVLDEAQVIKNAETKRARAAMRLRARLRVATTGTPIENRLEDLHSIFSFLNPGLLGSAQSFQARFARPIERDHDSRARVALQKLIAPFVLRRTKTQVLPELPARTEVTLRVPLELEEMATYEVIREETLAQLAHDVQRVRGAGPRRLQIFAMIMRLRRAASNARLVLPDAKGPSSKLSALGELLDDLLPNQHKLLVFSQFVDHLALVKKMLDERGVSYQYLDGSTPMAARKVAVDSFQAGQGEVFLISLKAGGFGLNLTAADYVVHMDPWWNPAVEDQASDRAHRIGQSRPVTIYRLVARDTIEDSILGLHHRKRELATGVLESSDLAGSMTEAELIDLIRAAT